MEDLPIGAEIVLKVVKTEKEQCLSLIHISEPTRPHD